MKPGLVEEAAISAIAERLGKTPAQVLLAWAVQRCTALLTTHRTADRARENFNISALPEDAFDEINRIQIRQRLNDVVNTDARIVSFHELNRHESQTMEGSMKKNTSQGRPAYNMCQLNLSFLSVREASDMLTFYQRLDQNHAT